MQNYNKKSDFARIIAKKSVPLHSETKISETMTREQEKQLRQLMKNVDIIDIMKIALVSCTKYNRRILKFFRWFVTIRNPPTFTCSKYCIPLSSKKKNNV